MTFKKLLPKFLISCSILAGLSLMTLINFKLNAIYYYQNSAVTDKDGIPCVVLDNLDLLVAGFEKNEEFTYEIDGVPYIYYYPPSNPTMTYIFSAYTDSYSLNEDFSSDSSSKPKWYIFSKNYKLVQMGYWRGETIPITPENESFAKQTLKTMTDPLLERVSAPIINLQWLYDGVYWIKERIK